MKNKRIIKSQVGNNNNYVSNEVNEKLVEVILELVKSQSETIKYLQNQLTEITKKVEKQ